MRTPQEYKAGHITESINIPLNKIPNKVNELRRKNKPIITCCRSGARMEWQLINYVRLVLKWRMVDLGIKCKRCCEMGIQVDG